MVFSILFPLNPYLISHPIYSTSRFHDYSFGHFYIIHHDFFDPVRFGNSEIDGTALGSQANGLGSCFLQFCGVLDGGKGSQPTACTSDSLSMGKMVRLRGASDHV